MLDKKLFEEKKDYPVYVPSDEEMTKVSFVKNRFKAMQQARTIVDKDRDIYKTMIDARYEPYPDERSSSTVPLASSIIELFVAEATKLETIWQFKGETSEHTTAAKALEYVWKYDWRRKNRKKVFTEAEYLAAGFGTNIIYTGYAKYNKTQKDPIMGDDGEIKREDKKYIDEGIVVENVDIRHFYIDNHSIKGIEDANDCIWIIQEGYEQFMKKQDSKVYKNVDKVKPKHFTNEYKPFTTDEENIKEGTFVETVLYWNLEKDIYMEVANGVVVREHPIISTMDGKKALPFTVRGLGFKIYSIYHRGICEPLMMFNSELNTLRELLMDGIRRSNTQVLAIGNGLSFDGRSFSYDNEILTFDGNLANNFQQISGNPPNQAIFSYLTQLYKDIAVFIGIDIQNIIGEPQQTAYQTEVQREASQKRINVWLQNRDLAYERFANLYKDLLQRFFPSKDAEGLYPNIEIEGEAFENNKFRKKKGKHTFEVKPEMLRGDIFIDVYTNVNAPTINAVEKEQKKGLMMDLGVMAQSYAQAKQMGYDIEEVLPRKNATRDLVSAYNLEPHTQVDDDNKEVQAEKEKLFAELKGMMSKPQVPEDMGMGAEGMEMGAEPQRTGEPLSDTQLPGAPM